MFAQQVNRSVEQSSKEALEDTLSQLSRLPSGCAISIVRNSIEGQCPPEALGSSLRSLLLQRSCSGATADDSMASTPLRFTPC